MELHGISEGHGPNVVLLHAAGLDLASWREIAVPLARNFTVLSLDLRGHGSSPPSEKGVKISNLAADVFAAMDRRGVASAAVVGISLGGMVAQTMALMAPERVSALVVCAAPGGIPETAREAMRERGLGAEREGMEVVVEPTITRWFTPGFRDSEAADRVRARLRRQDVASWSATWHAIADFDVRPELASVVSPTLVVAGEQDLATSAAASRAVADAIPGARHVTVPDAPHMMQIECPAPVLAAIAAFLDGVSPPKPAAPASLQPASPAAS